MKKKISQKRHGRAWCSYVTLHLKKSVHDTSGTNGKKIHYRTFQRYHTFLKNPKNISHAQCIHEKEKNVGQI